MLPERHPPVTTSVPIRREPRLHRSWAPAVACALLAGFPPALASAQAGPPPPEPALFETRDVWFGAAAAAGVAIASGLDRTTWHESGEAATDPRLRSLASAVRPLGSPVTLAPGLMVSWAAGRLLERPELSRASVRMALSIGAAGAACEGLKLAVGRMRPRQSPGDPDEFRPFSGDASFPSGHTTLAFAAASAIDQETSARWVPWVAYPAATMVGWSRLEDDQHWLSDVAAGAALGWWTARKVDRMLRDRDAAPAPADGGAHYGLIFSPRRGHTRLGVRVRF